jgi:aryl-alcohol dehydrogenase-like predicted oxidoreductase
MSEIKRRDFLAVMAGAAIGTGRLGRPGRAEEAAPAGDAVPPPPQVPLGKTGITMSRVGQGTGMNGGNRQSNHTRMGFEKLVALLRHSYERGVTFFDMADLYGTHVYFREALRHMQRDKITILTKLWWRYDGNPSQTPAEFKKKSTRMALERFCHEIITDHLDIVLLHCLEKPDWPAEMGPYMDALSEAKDRKQVRAVGVSCHNFGALETAASLPWVDVILVRINPKGARMEAPTDKVVPVIRKARENGKAIIGMKIYGEGSLSDMKEECIRFAQNLGLLDAMTVGAERPEQMDETLRLIAKFPAAKVL